LFCEGNPGRTVDYVTRLDASEDDIRLYRFCNTCQQFGFEPDVKADVRIGEPFVLDPYRPIGTFCETRPNSPFDPIRPNRHSDPLDIIVCFTGPDGFFDSVLIPLVESVRKVAIVDVVSIDFEIVSDACYFLHSDKNLISSVHVSARG
jgi:hypothetical protein